MSGDDTPTTPDPTAPGTDLDPAGLKDALGRTGRMLKTAGLPFDEDEFDDADDADDDSLSASSEGESSSSSEEE